MCTGKQAQKLENIEKKYSLHIILKLYIFSVLWKRILKSIKLAG